MIEVKIMKSNFVSFMLLTMRNQKYHLICLLQKTAVGFFAFVVGCCAVSCNESQQQMSASEKHTTGWKIPFDGSYSGPVLVAGVIYVGSKDGAVYALDPKNGEIKWRFQTGEGLVSGPQIITVPPDANLSEGISSIKIKGKREVHATPVVENGTVFVGSKDYSFYAIDAVTGEKKWSFQAYGMIYDKAIVQNGLVFFVSDQGFLYAIDALTGQKQWAFQTLEGPDKFAKRPPSEPILDNGIIYITNWPYGAVPQKKSFLYAIDAKSGKLKWTFSVVGNDIGAPTVASGHILFSTYSDETRDLSNFYAVDAISGKMKWEFQATTGNANTSAFTVLDMTLFGTTHGMYAVDLETGTLRWSRVENESGRIYLVDSLLYWTTIGELHILDPVTGKDKWSFTHGSFWATVAAVHDDTIYVSGNKKLYCLHSETGKELWSFKMETGHDALPLIANGMVFITTIKQTYAGVSKGDQGYFYAIDAKTGEIRP